MKNYQTVKISPLLKNTADLKAETLEEWAHGRLGALESTVVRRRVSGHGERVSCGSIFEGVCERLYKGKNKKKTGIYGVDASVQAEVPSVIAEEQCSELAEK